MSEKESSPDKSDPKPDLSELDFGPAWARKKGLNKPRREARASKGSRGRDDKKRTGNPRGRAAGGDKRDFSKENSRRRPAAASAPPAEGVSARIMPIEEGMDAMAKQISATGRTHSVFELATVVLGGLDRFHVIFETEKQPIYRSLSDHSVWLSKKECLAHFWSSGLVKKYYREELTEVDPPSGNFQSVARCGISGKLIGPPNHHAYQQTVLDLHRDRFSNMSLDHYKSKIVMEHGEEAVQQWLDMMKKHIRWSPKIEKNKKSEESEAVKEAAAEKETETIIDLTENTEIEETLVILNTRAEVEQHFLADGFKKEFENGTTISALANIPVHMVSPGLMSLLKNTVMDERRYPSKLAPILCRQMSGRHLAVFKWNKRLYCGPARPKKIPDEMVMADRPAVLFQWVRTHPGGSIDVMWKDSLPADIDDATRTLWYHDLHWLINEGLVLLLSDGTLHASKPNEATEKKD